MPFYSSLSYKNYPFVRLFFPFAAGIIVQWYLKFPLSISVISFIAISASLLMFSFLKQSGKFISRWLRGLLILLSIACLGMMITYAKDVRNNAYWFEKYYTPNSMLLITLQEPLAEKNRSYKAIASVNAINKSGEWKATAGKILIYFKKEEIPLSLNYGSQIILKKSLQPISNSGNPGAFDYKRYCLFQGITSQVFLKNNEYVISSKLNTNPVKLLIFKLRDSTVYALKKYIPGKKEQGVAEALLIGYRNDLDKDLVQSYSNTGVVHIIAISGLHLGMIYGLLLWIFSFFKRFSISPWLKPLSILFILWLFTLVAGAAPLLRAAVMFTFLIIGEALSRKTNIYNTLAASAFCLLILNPFFLWDVGFQLSYAAVISIVTFMLPIYNWLYFKNKLLDNAWKLNAITLSAQILTLPLILYHFHQFSNLFWLTNFIAVPLSAIILYSELILLCFNWLTVVAKFIGIITGWLILLMNSFIESADRLPFSVSEAIKINILQAILLYAFLILCGIWLMKQHKFSFIISLCFFALFAIFRMADIMKHSRQQRMIVYNVPKYTAIDFISGFNYHFAGDSVVLKDNFLRNFHLKPARVMHRLSLHTNELNLSDNIIHFNNKKVLLLNQSLHFKKVTDKIPVDVIVLSKNPNISIHNLYNTFLFREIVFDSSNPLWKIERWKKDCSSLHLRLHSVPEQGAFVMDIKGS